MKKSLKKLSLSRETIHNLSGIRGGAVNNTDNGIDYTGCGSECSACGQVCEAAPVQNVQVVRLERAISG